MKSQCDKFRDWRVIQSSTNSQNRSSKVFTITTCWIKDTANIRTQYMCDLNMKWKEGRMFPFLFYYWQSQLTNFKWDKIAHKYGFSSSHVWMWKLDHKESWAPKNWCFWTVMLKKTLESPLDYKEIKSVHPKENQSWTFTGRTDAEAEIPILRPPDAKNWLIAKDPDAGEDWRQEKRTENEMLGWHHWLKGHEFEQAQRVGDGQGSLACCSPWDCKESDMTERLNWTNFKGHEIAKYYVVIKCNLELKFCVELCSDCRTAMTRKQSEIVTQIKEFTPNLSQF